MPFCNFYRAQDPPQGATPWHPEFPKTLNPRNRSFKTTPNYRRCGCKQTYPKPQKNQGRPEDSCEARPDVPVYTLIAQFCPYSGIPNHHSPFLTPKKLPRRWGSGCKPGPRQQVRRLHLLQRLLPLKCCLSFLAPTFDVLWQGTMGQPAAARCARN